MKNILRCKPEERPGYAAEADPAGIVDARSVAYRDELRLHHDV